jgi:hypothetical protein
MKEVYGSKIISTSQWYRGFEVSDTAHKLSVIVHLLIGSIAGTLDYSVFFGWHSD